jgi:hypothetical protein
MKKIIFLIPIILLGNVSSEAQTLKVEFAEKILGYSKTKVLDTLAAEGFVSLTDAEIFKEAVLENSNVSLPETKKRLYTTNKIRKVYELRKAFGGGICNVTLSMREPTCNKVSVIRWNANLQWSARRYAMEFESLGYVKNSQGDYINSEKGITVIIKINKSYNELVLIMTKDL